MTSSAISSTTTVTTMTSQVTTTATTVTPCTPQWSILVGQNSVNGRQTASTVTLDACRQQCNDNVQCVAVDWDTTSTPSSCWLHTSASDLDRHYSSPGVTQYVLTLRCNATGT